jgi:enterochelin esterase-like enzyme
MKKLMGCVFTMGLLSTALFAQTPCKPTVVGRLETLTLNSRIFHNTRKLHVWLPPNFDPAVKYPVLYLLDGLAVFDACSFGNQEMGADETLTQLITDGRIPPVIAVAIDNGSQVLSTPDDGRARASEFLAYGDGLNPVPFVPLGAAFPDFLETDVMPAVAAKYPVADRRRTHRNLGSLLWRRCGDLYDRSPSGDVRIRHHRKPIPAGGQRATAP